MRSAAGDIVLLAGRAQLSALIWVIDKRARCIRGYYYYHHKQHYL